METVLEDAAIEQVRATAVRCSSCEQRFRHDVFPLLCLDNQGCSKPGHLGSWGSAGMSQVVNLTGVDLCRST